MSNDENKMSKYAASLTNAIDPVAGSHRFLSAMSRWDFFFRRENNSRDPRAVPATCITLDLPLSTTLGEALQAALAAGMPGGSHRTGCFEVQNDAGIFAQVDGNRMDLSTPRKAAKVEFKSWEQVEAEEAAE